MKHEAPYFPPDRDAMNRAFLDGAMDGLQGRDDLDAFQRGMLAAFEMTKRNLNLGDAA